MDAWLDHPLLTPCLMIAAGLLILALCARGLCKSYCLLESELHGTVVGKITGHDESYDEGKAYAPIVEYKVMGTVYTLTGSVSSGYKAPIGKEMKVIYRKLDPKDARLHTFTELWLFPILFILVGAALLGFGAYNAKETYDANIRARMAMEAPSVR